jgi:hypothetical protein
MATRTPLTLCDEELGLRQKCKDDFTYYAPRCLRIRTKSGKVGPLELNRAQQYLHGKLEDQQRETSKVRALVLKGRQQGASTYIGGRFYHKTTHRRGYRTFILTHEQTATDTLFEMVDRYHSHCPPAVRPKTGAANAKELSFSALDSGYQVGTAGSKAVGRSKTLQLFHGSEVAFWPNAASHFAGVVQAVPDEADTEIILESTANGVGGEFHERWQQAEAGIGDYIAIFIPWFWQEEYRRPVPPGFVLTIEEEEYKSAHGLDDGQMAWRRNKIAELKDPLLFMQEYPATASEAFQMSGHDSFIKSGDVLRARKSDLEGIGPKVMGVDPARFGDDRFSIALRQGRKVHWIDSKSKVDTVQGANWVRQMVDLHKPARVFVDVGGLGAGVVDLLTSWGVENVAVNFGGEPQDEVIFLDDGTKQPGARNRRAEMWMRSRDWLKEVGGADIPDRDSLQADACGPAYHYDANQRVQLEGKEQMRKRGVRSPDEWDALALTFAETVAVAKPFEFNSAGGGSWLAS